MKIFKLIAFVFSVSLVSACTGKFSIEADTGSEDYDGVKVYMIRKAPVDNSGNIVLDSTVIAGRHFTFSRKMTGEPCIVMFELAPKAVEGHTVFYHDLPTASCVAEPGHVSLAYSQDGAAVSGTPWNDDYDRFVLAPSRRARALSREYAERTSESDSIRAFYAAAVPEYIAFVRKYADTEVGAAVFFSRGRSFYPDSAYTALSRMMAPEYLEQERAREARFNAERKAAEAAFSASREGNPFIDFMSETPDGRTVRFSDAVKSNEAVLLVFWASWCRPCRAEIPQLKRLYDEYRDAGLEIVGVSLDADRAAWEKAMETENMPWPQWSTFEGFDSESAKSYAVHSIPYVVLIDSEGMIASVNKHGEALEKEIGNLL